ncbi:MAG: hypothetical protein HY744_31675, partial [Deltaproteobacteria bacterium]|nr:hypothetical protein [Deltaproteobacteria bacterium]
QVCSAGSCGLVCVGGTTKCSGKCVDTTVDAANCGSCGNACPQGQICTGGACALVCGGGSTKCGNVCTNTQVDPQNCGSCGNACPQGQMCASGACTVVCPPGQTKCGNACVDTQTDAANCGSCGAACAKSEACVAGKCTTLGSCKAILAANPKAGDGAYSIDVDGDGPKKPFDVRCDMTTAGGGWALALNLDTSDGHVMWWDEPLWTNAALYGSVQNALTQDHKSEAWNSLSGATELLLMIHEQGLVRGFKRFTKADGKTMYDVFQSGDNTLLGTGVLGADTAQLWPNERLVRLSNQLHVNHCVQEGGACTSGSSGSPDGDRISSNEATPSGNNGGGLGNWHDMHYCCPPGKSYGSGKVCNGSAFRTTSEAQAGWSSCSGQQGFFGTDTFGPATNTCNDGGCDNANWSQPNGVAYDYALWLR